MRLSIALATYNGEPYLSDQLASYLQQTRLPDEVVVCDDGSSDRTPQILADFAASAPFEVRLFQNERRLGYVRNFEKAAGLCSGDVIFFSDQDDWWLPEKLTLMEGAFARQPSLGLVFHDSEITDSALQPFGLSDWQRRHFSRKLQAHVLEGRGAHVLLSRLWTITPGNTVAFHSSLRRWLLPFSQATGHDEWTALMACCVADVSIVPHKLILYRRHPHNATGSLSPTCPAVVVRGAIARRRRTPRKNTCLRLVRVYEDIRQRLATVPAEVHPPNPNQVFLDQRIAFLKRRSEFPCHRMARIPSIVRELLALTYFRFGEGLKDLFRDAFERDW